MQPAEKELQNILDQSPEGTTVDRVIDLWMKHEGNTVAIITELWGVPAQAPAVQKTPHAAKWDDIRQICDAHDEAMEKFFKKTT